MATIQSTAERRMVLRNISWDTYLCLLADHGSSSVPRFVYDRGELEITMPFPEHERYKRLFEMLLTVAARELGMRVYSLGSATFKREDLEQGFEADSCFYIQNLASVRGKGRIDLRADPPPDLVIEIDITNPSLPKLPIYARFGVPEVWRYDGRRLEILLRQGDSYQQRDESHALPGVTETALSALLDESGELDDLDWQGKVIEWARSIHRSRSHL